MTDTLLRYPIGPFAIEGEITDQQRGHWIAEIAALPAELRTAVAGLGEEQLDTPYRPGGWTVRQVVHHVPDSHLNAYTRFKLALTEETPTIRPYDEAGWAELADSRTTPLEVSLSLLQALHGRWVHLLRSMTAHDFARGFVHPEHGRASTLERTLAMYAWHGRHHVAHVTTLREREGW
jgi:hypothetical protein